MKIAEKCKVIVAGAIVASILASCSASNSTPGSRPPSGSSESTNPPASSSSSSENTDTSKDKIDFSIYPVSDPSTWAHFEHYKYEAKVQENGMVTFTGVTLEDVIPTLHPDNIIYLDGYPIDSHFGAKYAWDGKNLRCIKQPTKQNQKLYKDSELTERPGYKYVCFRTFYERVESILSVSYEMELELGYEWNGWVPDEKLDSIVSGLKKEYERNYHWKVIVLEKVPLNKEGKPDYQTFLFNGKFYR